MNEFKKGNEKPVYKAPKQENIVEEKPAIEKTHTVQKNETLVSIGMKYGKNYIDLAKYNGIADPTNIHVGDKIKIPD